ncbi:hypothetical protein BDN72DRAFT_837714 [Pluteus cervinus]|uniref:Uncharacterized protein n=1 Tax=Pluteus cervinus TaxID=181527 RepID=A0ACD3AZY5_9AGAR|nr:hypothetical protein BDN72DRAFT_837714 [Pluteus cervinus]
MLPKAILPATSSEGGNIPPVDRAYTALLMTVRSLIQALTDWCEKKVDEDYVLEIMDTIEGEYKATKEALDVYEIDMSEFDSIPTSLRNVVEKCVYETQAPGTLEIYLPNVQVLVQQLMIGLMDRQVVYKGILIEAPELAWAAGTKVQTNS